MSGLDQQHVLILGLGASGLAMARWCAGQGARVTVADTREAPPQLATLRAELPDVEFIAGPFTAGLVEGQPVRAVFRSPGLSPAQVAPVLDAARATGLWTGGELDLFAQALADLRERHGYAPRVVAITGTNGKTTVTSLTGQLIERAGRRVAVAGNIGPTLLDTLGAALREAQAAVDIASAETSAEADAQTAEGAGTEAVKGPGVQESGPEPGASLSPVDASVTAEDGAPPEDDGQALPEAAADTPSAIELPTDDDEPLPAPVVTAPVALTQSALAQALPDVWVLELSSFQLDGVQGFEPSAATVLNITQDHLDWHGDMEAYAAAKARIFGGSGAFILNRDDARVAAMQPAPVKLARGEKARPRDVVFFGGDMPRRPGDFGIEVVGGMAWLVRALEADETVRRKKGEEEEIHIQRLMPADALRIRGRHNAVNALAALALATSIGCSLAPMLYGLREYRGEPHRVEPIGIVDGIEYFDDSKGTNVGATVAALQGLGADRRVVVILGGDGKGQDFSPLAEPVARFARAVVLIGRDAPPIRAALEATGVSLIDAPDLPAAVARATERAHAGDAVLMSPACASFDMFRNYEHRADVFRAAVAALADEAGAMLEGGEA
jgi:UDP-N-acetylmuramoylalanine--D-glutamate ligase